MIKNLRSYYVIAVSFIIFSMTSNVRVFAVNIQVMGSLPSQLVESSGIDYTGTSGFWTHNDGYGDNKLYEISSTGALIKTITVQGAVNNDWEDITHDAGRVHMYIGDFGNNANGRTNLHIYKIPYPSSITGNTVTAQVINFSYPDQTQFPSPWMNFDAEGFFHLNGHLFVFSKSAGAAVGYTKMYMLPDAPGTYVATLVDSFYTNDRTTSADISPDGSAMILITDYRIHLFRNFSGCNFFEGQHTMLNINGAVTQKEAVAFYDNQTVYMTDEDAGSGNFLYYSDLSNWLPLQQTGILSPGNDLSVFEYPNPAHGSFTIELKDIPRLNLRLQLYDLTGKLVHETRRDSPVSSIRMETADLPGGVYFYKLFADNRELRTARLVVEH